jgi:phosphoribosylformylglycinamidine synthase
MKPNALILQAHGTNRDHDAAAALTLAGAEPQLVPLNHLRLGKKRFADYQMLVLAGGFSYADALGAGKLLSIDLQAYFADEVRAFVDSGKPVIGICNGFQTLVKSGILPGGDVIARSAVTKQSPVNMPVTLTFNARGRFECRWVSMKPISQTCIWTQGLTDLIDGPTAHGEGNFQVSDPSLLEAFQKQDQVALVYARPDGSAADGNYPANPNGSVFDIAGLCNPQGNVLGLMPHPENNIYPWQHLQWTRNVAHHSGLVLFENGVKYAANV